MTRMLLRLGSSVKRRLREMRRRTKDKGLAMRCQIVLLAGRGYRRGRIIEAVGCSASWADRVLKRYREHGVAGLLDRREDNGEVKLDEQYLATLHEVVAGSPQDYGCVRPTWTLELLVKVMMRLTGVKVHTGTMSRALNLIHARRGRPRPTVRCPWSERRKTKRIRVLRDLAEAASQDEVVVYADEVDVHLNPKIGPDWMVQGQQKEVVTPGQNVKRYLAGAQEARTGRLTWVEGERKNSSLFITLLHALRQTYPQAKRIHVILDNYRIHSSKIAQQAMLGFAGKIVLHFLPPYCPQENKIERLWLDLHANVTRNHTCATITELMRRVRDYLRRRNARLARAPNSAAA